MWFLGKIIVATGFEWLPKVQKMPNLVTLPGIAQFKITRIQLSFAMPLA